MENPKTPVKAPERVMIQEFTQEINKCFKDSKLLLPGIQEVVNEFIKLNIGTIETDDLVPAITNAKSFYDAAIDKLIEQPSETVGRFKKKKSSLLDELELPSPAYFMAAAEKVMQVMPHSSSGLNLFSVEDNQVIINEEEFSEIEESKRVYLTDPAQIRAYQMVENLAVSITELNAFTTENFGISLFLPFSGAFKSDTIFIGSDADKVMRPNPAFFRLNR